MSTVLLSDAVDSPPYDVRYTSSKLMKRALAEKDPVLKDIKVQFAESIEEPIITIEVTGDTGTLIYQTDTTSPRVLTDNAGNVTILTDVCMGNPTVCVKLDR